MTPTFSPYWDRLARRAVREGNPALLKHGREIELAVMGLVQFPERIQQHWNEGRFETLAYLAEYIHAGIPPVIEHTDLVLFKNLTTGMSRLRQLGWHRRLRPGPLRARAAKQRRKDAAPRQ